MLTLFIFIVTTNNTFTIDFGTKKESRWSAVNDGVMGGLSEGKVSYSDEVLSFVGSVSLRNNGGFASVRSNYEERNLSRWQSVTIRYRCEGQSLSFGLEHYQRWYLPKYKVLLPETDMKWEEMTFQLADFKEYKIGRPTGSFINQANLAKIIRLNFMTNDKKEGDFKAEIDFITFKN